MPESSLLSRWRITPPQLFVGSFALLIAFGALGFRYLPGLYTGERLDWLDCLFTSTSAVCVTGMVVVDTATYFTFAGQAFILLLIQLGGLGVLAFTSLIIVALGRRLSLRQEALSTGTLEIAPHIDTRRLAIDVVRFTFAIEAIGALALYLLWFPRMGLGGALWPAIFHSVSAFCNAGFSTRSDSLMGLNDSPLTLLVIGALIVAGGIGFLTLEEVWLRYKAGKTNQIFRVSLHSRMVLTTTAVLLLGGWFFFALFEWTASLEKMPLLDKLSNSLFLSITCRTAGFNCIDYTTASDSGNFLTILLMSIGGSPGSTAGGIKTTTFALIALVAWSRFRGMEFTSLWSRSLRKETIERAIGLFVFAFVITAMGVFVLNTTEHFGSGKGDFLSRMFEVVSAFSTVGLSMNLTPDLSSGGRFTTIILMFVGRIGPLTVAASLMVRQTRQSGFRFAYEDVVVG